MPVRTVGILVSVLFAAQAGRARVLLRWTEPSLPAAPALGVSAVVVSWGARNSAMLEEARRQGYRVYAEVAPSQAESVMASARAKQLSGILIRVPGDGPVPGSLGSLMARLRSAHPGFSVRLLEPGGKQPQMKGSMVVDRRGVLEISSPTRQPWIDSNVALIRFERVYDAGESPLVDFQWIPTGSLEEKYGPQFEDYALAVAEAGAFHADLVLPVSKPLQDGLVQGKPEAWREWRNILAYVRFYAAKPAPPAQGSAELISNVGVVTSDYGVSYEAMNLMARHNIPFHVIEPRELANKGLKGLALIVVFSPPSGSAARNVERFTERGGTTVLVGQHGNFAWHSPRVIQKNAGAAVYAVGAGKLVEVGAPIVDPEPFARDVWRLLSEPEREISLWNALTTLAAAYRETGGTVVELVNYSRDPIRVQVRVKGQFSRIRYATPERGCCTRLRSVEDHGFTEFVVPQLRIGGRVYLN